MKQRVSNLHRMLLSYSRISVRNKRGHSSVAEYLTAEGVWQQRGAKQLRKSTKDITDREESVQGTEMHTRGPRVRRERWERKLGRSCRAC